MSTAVEQRLTELWETPKTLHGLLGTVDHKELGKRYIVTALAFLVIGGVEALIMRLQLARPDKAPADAGNVQPDLHHARHDDDLLVRVSRFSRALRLS